MKWTVWCKPSGSIFHIVLNEADALRVGFICLSSYRLSELFVVLVHCTPALALFVGTIDAVSVTVLTSWLIKWYIFY